MAGSNRVQREAPAPVTEESHPDLFANVAAKLSQLGNDEWDAVAPEQAAERAEDVIHNTAVVDADDDAADAIDSGEEVESQEAAADGAPTLPQAIRRSLKAYQWSEDEIDEAFARDPDGFLATASKIHATRVQETQQWAALGRQQQEQDDAPAKPAAPASVPVIDFDSLADESGIDRSVLEKMFTPVVNAIDTLNQVLPDINNGVAAIESNKQAELARQIDSFFQSEDLKPYTEFYGHTWDECSDAQQKHRDQVLELADHMITGAAVHGRRLNAFEAMELAHHTVASEETEGVVRKKLAAQVQSRRNGTTIKPTNRKAPEQTGPMSRDQLLSVTAQRLRKAFG